MKAYFIKLIMVLLLAVMSHGLLLIYIAERGSFPVEAEYWVGDELILKKWLADRVGSDRRILILSGSSGLFGIDSGLIERRTGLKTINLSTHGGLSLNFQLDYADKIVRAGDLIILPLEYEYYQRRPSRYAGGSSQIALAVLPEMFRGLPLAERLGILLRVEPRVLWDGAHVSVRRLVQPDFMRQRTPPDLESVILKWKSAPHAGPTQYGVETTDEHGDIEHNCESKNLDWNYSVTDSSFDVSTDAIGALKTQAARWKERGAKVYVSFPAVSTEVASARHFHEQVEKLTSLLEKAGIETLGQPGDFLFQRRSFFNTRYHLNCVGRVKRTLILLRYLTVP